MRIYEDILDDLEHIGSDSARKLTDDIENERRDVDDAEYFTHQMYIPLTDIGSSKLLSPYPPEMKKTLFDAVEQILDACRYVDDYSDVVCYTGDDDVLEMGFPYMRRPKSSAFRGTICFSIKASFPNIKYLFRFLTTIYKALSNKPYGHEAMFVEFVASDNGEWMWQKEEYEYLPGNANVDLSNLYNFTALSEEVYYAKHDPTHRMIFMQNSVIIADAFFLDRSEVFSQFEHISPKRFLEPISTLFIHKAFKNGIAKGASEIWLPDSMMKRSMTFAIFMDTVRNIKFDSINYLVRDFDKPIFDSCEYVAVNSNEDNISEIFIEQDIVYPNYRCIYNNGRIYFYTFLGVTHEENPRSVMLQLSTFFIQTSDSENAFNKERAELFVTLVASLFGGPVSQKSREDAVKNICWTIAEAYSDAH